MKITIHPKYILACAKAAGTEDSRFILKAVSVEAKRGKAVLCAADGRILFAARTVCEDKEEGQLLLPIRLIKAAKMLAHRKELATVSDDGDSVSIEYGGMKFSSAKIVGNYPTWRQVIPESFEKLERLTFSCKWLTKLISCFDVLKIEAVTLSGSDIGSFSVNPPDNCKEEVFGIIMANRANHTGFQIPNWIK